MPSLLHGLLLFIYFKCIRSEELTNAQTKQNKQHVTCAAHTQQTVVHTQFILMDPFIFPEEVAWATFSDLNYFFKFILRQYKQVSNLSRVSSFFLWSLYTEQCRPGTPWSKCVFEKQWKSANKSLNTFLNRPESWRFFLERNKLLHSNLKGCKIES